MIRRLSWRARASESERERERETTPSLSLLTLLKEEQLFFRSVASTVIIHQGCSLGGKSFAPGK